MSASERPVAIKAHRSSDDALGYRRSEGGSERVVLGAFRVGAPLLPLEYIGVSAFLVGAELRALSAGLQLVCKFCCLSVLELGDRLVRQVPSRR